MKRPIWEMAFATAKAMVGEGAVMFQIKVAIWTVDGPPTEEVLPTYYGWDEAIPALLKDGWEPMGQERVYVQGELPILTRLFKRQADPKPKPKKKPKKPEEPEPPKCTCAVSLWLVVHLPECPRGHVEGHKRYETWDDVPDDVLTWEKYVKRHGEEPPTCPNPRHLEGGLGPYRVYQEYDNVCRICAHQERHAAEKEAKKDG